MRGSRALLVLLLIAGTTIAARGSLSSGSAAANLPGDDVGAADLFARHCAACHGPTGRGDGPAAARFETRPADLGDGLTKFRSTSQERPPLRSDLERTIREGSRGTAMVEWGSFLDPAQIEALASYAMRLEGYGDVAAAASVSAHVASPPSAGPTVADPAAGGIGTADGAALYARLGCAQCHGEDRRGSGPAAAGLVDARGRRLAMPDLTLLPYKRGSDPEETAKTLLYGMDGTPMAAFGGAISPAQASAVAGWLVDSASVDRRGFVGEEHLGFMTQMHEAGRHGGPGMRGHGMRGRATGASGMAGHCMGGRMSGPESDGH